MRASGTRWRWSAKSLKGPAIGPIYVNGAEPGDALAGRVPQSITPKEDPAHMVMPGRGFLEEDFTEAYPTVMRLEDGHLVLPSGLKLPLAPSMGLVATTPTYRQSTASDSGPYGGDIDMKELVAGQHLFLPVFVPGGLLAMGDCHAVVGDGAVAGTGAECSSDTHIRVTVEKGMGITGPRAITPGALRGAVPRGGPGAGHEAGGARHGGLPGGREGHGPLRRLHPAAAWRETCGCPAPSGPSAR